MKPHTTPTFEEQEAELVKKKKKDESLEIRGEKTEYTYFEESSQYECERYSEFPEIQGTRNFQRENKRTEKEASGLTPSKLFYKQWGQSLISVH